MKMGLDLLKLCSEIWVYGQPSDGMKTEILIAESLGIPVIYKNA